uniref:ABC transmembrane type-1 domain-containing protein n=1 Tax=Salix viminalis TaxID=40686 RepID=A0A6N2K579_SALVM
MREDTEGASTSNNIANGQKTTNGEDQKVAFHKLFTFADRLDVVLMIIGTLSAIANGLSQPLMTLIFGQLINSFGASDRSNIVKEVSKMIIWWGKRCLLRCLQVSSFGARARTLPSTQNSALLEVEFIRR